MPFVMEVLVEETRISASGKSRRVRFWKRVTSGEDYVFEGKLAAEATLKVLCGGKVNPANMRAIEVEQAVPALPSRKEL